MPGRENVSPTPYELPADPSLSDLTRQIQRLTKLSIRTHTPATILTYDPVAQVAELTVDHLQAVKVVDDVQLARVVQKGGTVRGTPPNAVATLPPLVIRDVPVVFPRTQAGYVTFPLAPGDTGELHVSDRNLSQWRQLGKPSDPLFAETHSLSDSVFYPGLHADTNPIVPPTDPAATVVEGPPVAGIKIGRGAVLGAARVTDPTSSSASLAQWALTVETALNAIAAAALVPPPFQPLGPAPSFAQAVAGQIGSITSGSTKVLIE